MCPFILLVSLFTWICEGCNSLKEAEVSGFDPCWPEAREHNAGGPRQAALQSQGYWLRFSQPCLQGCLLHIPAVQILQVRTLRFRQCKLAFSKFRAICRHPSVAETVNDQHTTSYLNILLIGVILCNLSKLCLKSHNICVIQINWTGLCWCGN